MSAPFAAPVVVPEARPVSQESGKFSVNPNIEDNSTWQSHAEERVWVFRFGFIFSVIPLLVRFVGLGLGEEFTANMSDAVWMLCVSSAALLTSKVRDNFKFMIFLCIVWTLGLVIFIVDVLVFLWNDHKTFIYIAGLKEGSHDELLVTALRIEPLPFVSVLTFAAAGIPMRVFLPLGAVMFFFEIVFSLALRAHVVHLSVTDYFAIIPSKLFHVAIVLYFAWTAETHQRRVRESLGLLKRTLRQWVREKEQDRTTRTRIVGYIFHEVRNPLNNIMLAADLLVDRVQQLQQTSCAAALTTEVAEMVDTISKAADSACHVLNDALSLQKLEAGTFEFVKQPFSLVKFQTQAIRIATPQMQQKQITLSGHIDAPLESINVIGDFNRLQQVLNNFLSNAYKFTPVNGRVEVRMTKEAEARSGSLRIMTIKISVQDSGAGIAQADHNRVFQAWSQIRASDLQQGQGSGLGLSLCKAFVEVGHNGKIGFTSDAGKGSSFFFVIDFEVCDDVPVGGVHTTIPQRRAHSGSATPPQNNRNSHSSANRRPDSLSKSNPIARVMFPTRNPSSKAFTVTSPVLSTHNLAKSTDMDQDTEASLLETAAERSVQGDSNPQLLRHETKLRLFTTDVLIVDDSLVTRKLLSKILAGLGVKYDACEDGLEAVTRIVEKGETYRLIIMDKEMPNMDGFEATRALRDAEYDLPVVGLTGNAMDDQVADFLSAGVNAVFSKPIKRDALIRLLTQYNIQMTVESQHTAQPQNLASPSQIPMRNNSQPTLETAVPPQEPTTLPSPASQTQSVSVLTPRNDYVGDESWQFMAGI